MAAPYALDDLMGSRIRLSRALLYGFVIGAIPQMMDPTFWEAMGTSRIGIAIGTVIGQFSAGPLIFLTFAVAHNLVQRLLSRQSS